MTKHDWKQYSSVMLEPEDVSGVMDFAQLFGRDAPVHIEIGSGKGTFLLSEARARPDVNFLGIEWARQFYLYALDRLGRWGVTNVRIIRTDAPVFVGTHVPPESVECFHAYFPDPWPKKRHQKRRLIQTYNLPILLRCLKTGGEIRLATDHAEYFQQMEEVADRAADLVEVIPFTRPAGAREGEVVGTNYERKYIKDNRTIRTLAVRKKPPQG
jgi:tRNA (guanine-N7-)-methyltransferase